ncbi:iron complex transport system substrate-binding protein [Pseudorhizobium tarimense]|uniref:Iron complex transport system substrate-binding protein n=1 Tax=Pseudorhizobium tarimense TaxID=1079109 RepID=A0ABV2H1G8_9HYPH
MAIGANVVAGAELRQFREVAVTPQVPPGVTDLGLRGLPNFEALYHAGPEVVFNSNFYASSEPVLARIAPVETHSIYMPEKDPFALAVEATGEIGELLNLTAAAKLIDEVEAQLLRQRQVMAAGDGRPVLPVNVGDARHYRVFGADSMFGAVLERLGLENAWKGATAYSANAPVGIETLATMPEAWIVLIPPHPADAIAALETSAFWDALPQVSKGRVLSLASVSPYGALPAAARFAELLTEGLSRAWNG